MNIIPVIAKSDAISKSELTKFKIKITSELVSNGVQIYQFPTDDESVAEINGTMNVSGGTGFDFPDVCSYDHPLASSDEVPSSALLVLILTLECLRLGYWGQRTQNLTSFCF